MRFLVAVVTHIVLQEGYVNGNMMMKFALNQHWKFESYKLAWLIGQMQVTGVLATEVSIWYILLF